MPVVAVLAAIAVDVTVPGIIAAGTLTTLGAVTAIGATLAAIGAVTGNKTLGLIGGGLGLVGGIATMAFGSGALGDVGDLFGSTASGAGGASGAAGAVDELGVAGGAATGDGVDALGVAGGAAGPSSGSGIVNAAGDLNAAAFDPANAINSSLSSAEGSASGIVTGNQTGSALGRSLSIGGTDANGTNLASGSVAGLGDKAFFSDAAGIHSATIPGFSASAAAPGGILNWAKNNPLLSYGIIQSGGSFLSGLTDSLKPAQIDALNAQANANNAAAALAEREAKNMAGSIPTASVTGMPVASGGLINSRPVATPLITGAPAAAPPSQVTGAPA